jgi:hypothetical protein
MTITTIWNEILPSLQIQLNSYMDDYYVTENIAPTQPPDYIYTTFILISILIIVSVIWVLMPIVMCVQIITVQIYKLCKYIINRIRHG